MSDATPKSEYVADTVALVLHLEKRKMGAEAKAAFAAMVTGDAIVYVPTMVLAEILYLAERGRIETSLSDVKAYMQQFPQCREHPLQFAVIEAAATIDDVPELHDRLIAGAAATLQVPLITNDTLLTDSTHVVAIW